jgi:hypothetical protein
MKSLNLNKDDLSESKLETDDQDLNNKFSKVRINLICCIRKID